MHFTHFEWNGLFMAWHCAPTAAYLLHMDFISVNTISALYFSKVSLSLGITKSHSLCAYSSKWQDLNQHFLHAYSRPGLLWIIFWRSMCKLKTCGLLIRDVSSLTWFTHPYHASTCIRREQNYSTCCFLWLLSQKKRVWLPGGGRVAGWRAWYLSTQMTTAVHKTMAQVGS